MSKPTESRLSLLSGDGHPLPIVGTGLGGTELVPVVLVEILGGLYEERERLLVSFGDLAIEVDVVDTVRLLDARDVPPVLVDVPFLGDDVPDRGCPRRDGR